MNHAPFLPADRHSSQPTYARLHNGTRTQIVRSGCRAPSTAGDGRGEARIAFPDLYFVRGLSCGLYCRRGSKRRGKSTDALRRVPTKSSVGPNSGGLLRSSGRLRRLTSWPNSAILRREVRSVGCQASMSRQPVSLPTCLSKFSSEINSCHRSFISCPLVPKSKLASRKICVTEWLQFVHSEKPHWFCSGQSKVIEPLSAQFTRRFALIQSVASGIAIAATCERTFKTASAISIRLRQLKGTQISAEHGKGYTRSKPPKNWLAGLDAASVRRLTNYPANASRARNQSRLSLPFAWNNSHASPSAEANLNQQKRRGPPTSTALPSIQ